MVLTKCKFLITTASPYPVNTSHQGLSLDKRCPLSFSLDEDNGHLYAILFMNVWEEKKSGAREGHVSSENCIVLPLRAILRY